MGFEFKKLATKCKAVNYWNHVESVVSANWQMKRNCQFALTKVAE
jgi:hypothetical protein